MGSIKSSSHSKADMLVVLSLNYQEGFKLPNFIVFSVEEWNRDSSCYRSN